MYCAARSEIVIPVMFSYVLHGDQPERRSINGLKLGQNTNHARWGYSVNYNAKWPIIKSCNTCKGNLSEHLSSGKCALDYIDNCSLCTNWETEEDNALLHHPLPKNFPPSAVHKENGMIGPLAL